LNWNFKMWGAVLAVVIVLSASGAYLSQQDFEGESVSIISRVNNDGSGIFVRNDAPDGFVTRDGGTVTYNADVWKGTLFMTPGPSSIQHMILMDIVKEEMGLDFVQQGSGTSTDAVFWTQVAPGQMLAWMDENTEVTGGIAWEPHYMVAIGSGKCKGVLGTGEYWSGHPCCVIAGNNSYLSNNQMQVERFLAAYVMSVEWMISAMDAGSGEDYEFLISKTISVGTPTDPMPASTAEAALGNIVFTYELGNLKEQLADVVDTYTSLGLVKPEALPNAGFETPLDFTTHLINETYLNSVFKDSDHLELKTPEEMGVVVTGAVRIKVAYLAADVHQLALHIGIAKGFFSDYGIEVQLVGPFAAGGDVMNALLAGQADIGFVGSPPVVSLSINALR
jgi:ABC-type nitrate/sulfonate/bicarbonate transport system substrate-binding protein